MFGSEILEVAIGLVFVFLLVSVLCAAIREGIEGIFKSRAAFLEYAVREMLNDRRGFGLANSLYKHPLVHSLYAGEYPGPLTYGKPVSWSRGGSMPSYIPTRSFALALLDITVRGEEIDDVSADPDGPRLTVQAVRANLRHLENPAVQRVLLTALDGAGDDLGRLVAAVERWYDSSMDRVSGMYKRASQLIIFIVGLVVAIGLNVSAIGIAQYLFRSESARSALVATADAAAANPEFLAIGAEAARGTLVALDLPIGWNNPALLPPPGAEPGVWIGFLLISLVGWLITATAAALGAPFWFDVLNKVMVIRSTVKPHEKSPEEDSEDRQTNNTRAVLVRSPEQEGDLVGAGSPARAAAVARTPTGAESYASPRDPESHLEGCALAVETETLDEELPPSRGGMTR